ncbi:MAG TPA: pyrrolysine--tRNA(Pyl) ligase large subunit [Bacillota bacterium]|nr:pyrrolysine--tRNA(Pyl) ligase large subunit [Bacillota bacterium]
MQITWTEIQAQRLKELNAPTDQQNRGFTTPKERDTAFQQQEKLLKKIGRQRLQHLKDVTRRPGLSLLESRLVEVLTSQGFVQVVTPTIIAKGSLAKMTITEEHPLFNQVFWLDQKKCLRPMLAPNLYALWRDLVRLWEKPIRIFEIGTCYRKESQGAQHLNEFTMLNLTELGLPKEDRHRRLEELASVVMEAADLTGYTLETETSNVYGDTVDVMKGELELGSGAMGPHFLDAKWGITDTWVGIGFGLERLLMVREGGQNVQSMGRSVTYLDGVRLNI